jgi:signal transduction histidine kinase
LVAALKRRATALRSRHNLEVDTRFCEEPELPFETKEALYRIAQEGLNNVVKHAQAGRLAIRLDSREQEVALEITDDGVGFDPERNYAGHMGLRSMQERASQAGAVLAIESAPGRGTRVRVLVPLPDSSQSDRPARA